MMSSSHSVDCQFWLAGTCRFGPRCRYKHDPNKEGVAPGSIKIPSNKKMPTANTGRMACVCGGRVVGVTSSTALR